MTTRITMMTLAPLATRAVDALERIAQALENPREPGICGAVSPYVQGAYCGQAAHAGPVHRSNRSVTQRTDGGLNVTDEHTWRD